MKQRVGGIVGGIEYCVGGIHYNEGRALLQEFQSTFWGSTQVGVGLKVLYSDAQMLCCGHFLAGFFAECFADTSKVLDYFLEMSASVLVDWICAS